MLEFDIRKAISDYMQSTGATRRTAILAANEVIKKLAHECRKEEQKVLSLRYYADTDSVKITSERPVCYDCGFWDTDQEGCTCPAPDRQYACEIEKKGV